MKRKVPCSSLIDQRSEHFTVAMSTVPADVVFANVLLLLEDLSTRLGSGMQASYIPGFPIRREMEIAASIKIGE